MQLNSCLPCRFYHSSSPSTLCRTGFLICGLGATIAFTVSVKVISGALLLVGSTLLVASLFKKAVSSPEATTAYYLPSVTILIPECSREAYEALGKEDHRKLAQEFETTFPDNPYLAREPFSQHWIKFIFSFSEQIFKDIFSNPHRENARIYGLGQTPAWPIEIGKLSHPDRTIGHIAFSGNWWYFPTPEDASKELVFHSMGTIDSAKQRRRNEKEKVDLLTKLLPNRAKTPDRKQIENKRADLASIGLDPRTIMSQKGPTVIVDYVQSAAGLKSFVSLIEEWAQELGLVDRLKEKLHLHFLCSDEDASLYGGQTSFELFIEANFFSYQRNYTHFETSKTRVLSALSRKEEERGAHPDGKPFASHRLVAKSPARTWGVGEQIYDLENRKNIQLIFFQIYKNMRQR